MRAVRLLIPTLVLLAACSDPASRSEAQPALAQPTRSPQSVAAGLFSVSAAVVVVRVGVPRAACVAGAGGGRVL